MGMDDQMVQNGVDHNILPQNYPRKQHFDKKIDACYQRVILGQ